MCYEALPPTVISRSLNTTLSYFLYVYEWDVICFSVWYMICVCEYRWIHASVDEHTLIAVWVCVCFSGWNSSVLWVRRVNVVKIALVSSEAPEEMGAIFTPKHLSHTYLLTLILQAHLLHIAIYSDHWGPNSDDLLMTEFH